MNVFFFFAGTRTRRQCIAETHADCPRCGRVRRVKRCRAESWAHLYWIPLWKVGDLGEELVCTECRLAFPDVRHGDVRHGGVSPGPAGGGTEASATPAPDRSPAATWTCAGCGNVNPRDAVTCLRCGATG